jgi:hypothetical protein
LQAVVLAGLYDPKTNVVQQSLQVLGGQGKLGQETAESVGDRLLTLFESGNRQTRALTVMTAIRLSSEIPQVN